MTRARPVRPRRHGGVCHSGGCTVGWAATALAAFLWCAPTVVVAPTPRSLRLHPRFKQQQLLYCVGRGGCVASPGSCCAVAGAFGKDFNGLTVSFARHAVPPAHLRLPTWSYDQEDELDPPGAGRDSFELAAGGGRRDGVFPGTQLVTPASFGPCRRLPGIESGPSGADTRRVPGDGTCTGGARGAQQQALLQTSAGASGTPLATRPCPEPRTPCVCVTRRRRPRAGPRRHSAPAETQWRAAARAATEPDAIPGGRAPARLQRPASESHTGSGVGVGREHASRKSQAVA